MPAPAPTLRSPAGPAKTSGASSSTLSNSKWYYGTAGDGSISGTFGTVAFSGTNAALTQLLSGVAAHGLTFDPFTNDIIVNSGTEIEQFDPSPWPANSGISVPQMGKAIYSARQTEETWSASTMMLPV
jgi:hypothetical protein